MLQQLVAGRTLALAALLPRSLPRHSQLAATRLRSLTMDASYDLSTIRAELASGEAQLFDVREPEEAAAGQLKDASLVPLSALQEGTRPACDRSAPPRRARPRICPAPSAIRSPTDDSAALAGAS